MRDVFMDKVRIIPLDYDNDFYKIEIETSEGIYELLKVELKNVTIEEPKCLLFQEYRDILPDSWFLRDGVQIQGNFTVPPEMFDKVIATWTKKTKDKEDML